MLPFTPPPVVPMDSIVKKEIVVATEPLDDSVIDLSSSDSDWEAEGDGTAKRRRKPDGLGGPLKKSRAAGILPAGFLDPLPPEEPLPLLLPQPPRSRLPVALLRCKQFWKAGDFDESLNPNPTPLPGMDHVRVHPKFLHSNATSHKWALGALAELLDNSLDEIMVVGWTLIKCGNACHWDGNGFKTSTMRLGADVIVFSRSHGKDGRRPTQSIGMLSYTFLRNTRKEDIVVPMLDYEKEKVWSKMLRSSLADWNTNLETIIQWSPYSSEADLLQQFSSVKDQGTRIVIYNLWEDDQGELELDFDADEHDIQVRGVNRDEKKIEMAEKFPNSRHFLTYRHSLRSYASILYLRLPNVFRMILRGKEVEHHNIVNDMMLKQEVTYKPQSVAEVVTIGFVKDAKDHIDVQGFNVYHKNRLIKPFWRVWSAAGSDGRGVIGVLEANFIEPAHDKQDFERTTILSRLEARLVQMQKTYWSNNCHRIGYAPRKFTSPSSRTHVCKSSATDKVGYKYLPSSSGKTGKAGASAIVLGKSGNQKSGSLASSVDCGVKSAMKVGKNIRAQSRSSGIHAIDDESDSETECTASVKRTHGSNIPKAIFTSRTSDKIVAPPMLSPFPYSAHNGAQGDHTTNGVAGIERVATRSQAKASKIISSENGPSAVDSTNIKQLKDENEELKKRIIKMEESTTKELQYERDHNKSLLEQLEAAQKSLEEANKEQEALIDIFSEERSRRDKEEENLRKKLKDASRTIQELLEKLAKGQNDLKS
ncbi:Histidine kinase-, DNA gyrase B-, and HSP90-like ATPase [Musa troglodytarum]|uniref:Histidine kinase-, DNA gyrase B-, and HSP90-like ATPase n=1 Tax=Musa troglodytarum TaxID=320322 RepID=A0A9E7EJQ8_9LILI|nr:Histidine kinase-, DNA gyrase B-, and HSP90-like ATPase [Musa troglodytarum]